MTQHVEQNASVQQFVEVVMADGTTTEVLVVDYDGSGAIERSEVEAQVDYEVPSHVSITYLDAAEGALPDTGGAHLAGFAGGVLLVALAVGSAAVCMRTIRAYRR